MTSEVPVFAIVIGAMKSGTTTLFDVLSQHPQVAPGRKKEPAFFGLEEVWSRGFDWYEALWDFDPLVHKVALEASTDYTKYPYCDDAAARMEAWQGREFKLIYIMRDPLERIESHARHVNIVKCELGLRLSERKDHSLDAGVSDLSWAISQYATQIDHYERFFQDGRLLLLVLEEYSADPVGALKKICRFLDIDDGFEFDVDRRSNTAVTRTRLHPVAKWALKSSTLIAVLRNLVPEAAKPWIKNRTKVAVRHTGRFRLNPEEEEAARARLAEEVSRLETKYGVNTSLWIRYHGTGRSDAE